MTTATMRMRAADGELADWEITAEPAEAKPYASSRSYVDCWVVVRRSAGIEEIAREHDGSPIIWANPDRAIADVLDGAAWSWA